MTIKSREIIQILLGIRIHFIRGKYVYKRPNKGVLDPNEKSELTPIHTAINASNEYKRFFDFLLR